MYQGVFLDFICSEVNLVLVPCDIRWIDIIHDSVKMLGSLRTQLAIDAKRYFYVEEWQQDLCKGYWCPLGSFKYGFLFESGESFCNIILAEFNFYL